MRRSPFTPKTIGPILRAVRRECAKRAPPVVTLIAIQSGDPFRVLISTILSLRTKDEVTAAASERIFSVATTPRAIRALSQRRIESLIYPVGFYRTKARALREIARILLAQHRGAVPSTMDELLALPGVGRKTANLVLIEGFKKPGMCVDTHVHRISNRWGLIRTRTPDESEVALRVTLPRKYWMSYNALLVGFGQTVCTPVGPRCSECPLRVRCPRIGVQRSR